jgi:soluble lytic murein transglycosylase-like protein
MGAVPVLRRMELALSLGMLTLLLIAGPLRPPRFHTIQPVLPASGGVLDATAPRLRQPPPPSVRDLLDQAALRHGLPPHLVEAVAYWESGWDESKVSATGAIGLMQVEPEVATELGPRLVGRKVDLRDPADNADIGAAILRAYIDDQGGSVDRGLAAYYQGPQSLHDDGLQPDTQRYVDGVQALRQLLDTGRPLPSPSPS